MTKSGSPRKQKTTILGKDFDTIEEIELDDKTFVLPVEPDDVAGCQLSSITTLADGTPVVIRSLPDLRVFLDQPLAVLDGEKFHLREQSALLLKGIVESKGDWVTNREIGERYEVFDPTHAHRAKRNLPEQLRDLIESKTGAGHRLRLVPQNGGR